MLYTGATMFVFDDQYTPEFRRLLFENETCFYTWLCTIRGYTEKMKNDV